MHHLWQCIYSHITPAEILHFMWYRTKASALPGKAAPVYRAEKSNTTEVNVTLLPLEKPGISKGCGHSSGGRRARSPFHSKMSFEKGHFAILQGASPANRPRLNSGMENKENLWLKRKNRSTSPTGRMRLWRPLPGAEGERKYSMKPNRTSEAIGFLTL